MNNVAVIGMDNIGKNVNKNIDKQMGDVISLFTEEDIIRDPLQFTRYDAVILVCSLGDEESPVLARLEQIKKHQRNLIFLGTTPFKWEGQKKSEIANEQRDAILSMITCAGTVDYNEFAAFIKKQAQPGTTTEAFSMIDDVMIQSVHRIAELPQFDATGISSILQEEINTLQPS